VTSLEIARNEHADREVMIPMMYVSLRTIPTTDEFRSVLPFIGIDIDRFLLSYAVETSEELHIAALLEAIVLLSTGREIARRRGHVALFCILTMPGRI
jgi:hypothetical protein